MRPLTPQEKSIIVDKKTETPFSGQYWDHWQEGIYHCRRCHNPLYQSNSKFQAHCGWPSFDQEIPGSVTQKPDPDGRRTEVICQKCQAHLGHVFTGEGLTPLNTRHCVNSLSLHFIPSQTKDTSQSS